MKTTSERINRRLDEAISRKKNKVKYRANGYQNTPHSSQVSAQLWADHPQGDGTEQGAQQWTRARTASYSRTEEATTEEAKVQDPGVNSPFCEKARTIGQTRAKKKKREREFRSLSHIRHKKKLNLSTP